MSWLFNTRPIGLGSHPEAKLSLPQPIYFRFLSSFLSRSYSLSLRHVAGHVGNITGEILSTINSPSPYWLTHQHSSSLAGHSPSALADRREMKAALALRSSVVVVVVPGVGLCSLLGATSDLALPVPSWADTTNGACMVQWATKETISSSSTGNLSRPWDSFMN